MSTFYLYKYSIWREQKHMTVEILWTDQSVNSPPPQWKRNQQRDDGITIYCMLGLSWTAKSVFNLDSDNKSIPFTDECTEHLWGCEIYKQAKIYTRLHSVDPSRSLALQDDAVMQGLVNVDIFSHLFFCRNPLLSPIDAYWVIHSNTCCCYKAKHLLLLQGGHPKLWGVPSILALTVWEHRLY